MEDQSERPKKPSRRKRLGKALLILGVSILVMSIVGVMIASVFPYLHTEEYVINWEGFGILIMVFGLILTLYPEGPSSDQAWIMKVTPFCSGA
jgi:hypothetical protein